MGNIYLNKVFIYYGQLRIRKTKVHLDLST